MDRAAQHHRDRRDHRRGDADVMAPDEKIRRERRAPRQEEKISVQERGRRAEKDHHQEGRKEERRNQVGHRRRARGDVRIPEGPLAVVNRLLEELRARLPLPPGRTRIADVGVGPEIAARPFLVRDVVRPVVLDESAIVDRVRVVRGDEGPARKMTSYWTTTSSASRPSAEDSASRMLWFAERLNQLALENVALFLELETPLAA